MTINIHALVQDANNLNPTILNHLIEDYVLSNGILPVAPANIAAILSSFRGFGQENESIIELPDVAICLLLAPSTVRVNPDVYQILPGSGPQ